MQRVETAFTLGVDTFFFVLTGITLFLWFFLKNQQPLKSRIGIPVLNTFLFFLLYLGFLTVLILMLSNVLSYEQGQKIYSSLLIILDYVFTIAIARYAFHFVRLVVFQNLASIQSQYLKVQMKEDRTKEMKELERMKRRAKLLQFLASPLCLSILTLLIIIIQVPIYTVLMIGLLLWEWTSIYRNLWLIVVASTAILIAIIFLSIDLVLFLKTHRKFSLYQYFISTDRLYTRLEVPFAVMAGIANLCVVVGRLLPGYRIGGALFYVTYVINFLRWFLAQQSLCGGFISEISLITTCLQGKRQNFKKNTPNHSSRLSTSLKSNSFLKLKSLNTTTLSVDDRLLELLNSPDGLDIINQYCKAEYSSENLECWIQIQTYVRKLRQVQLVDEGSSHLRGELWDVDRFRRLCVIIRDTFVKKGSVLETNISDETRSITLTKLEEVLEKANHIDANTTSESKQNQQAKGPALTDPTNSTSLIILLFPIHLFLKLEIDVMLNLLDTYQRLKLTSAYKKWVISQDLKNKQETMLNTKESDFPGKSNTTISRLVSLKNTLSMASKPISEDDIEIIESSTNEIIDQQSAENWKSSDNCSQNEVISNSITIEIEKKEIEKE